MADEDIDWNHITDAKNKNSDLLFSHQFFDVYADAVFQKVCFLEAVEGRRLQKAATTAYGSDTAVEAVTLAGTECVHR